jgi:hypothetical protein
MNKQETNDEDLLRKFLNPEKIEKAPEGFTSKTLTRIRIESQSVKVNKGFFAKNRVPVISAVITAGLIITALVIPAGETDSIGSSIWKYFQDIEFTLPDFNNSFFRDQSLPGWILYLIVGIFLLGFFDRALFGLFHKRNNP